MLISFFIDILPAIDLKQYSYGILIRKLLIWPPLIDEVEHPVKRSCEELVMATILGYAKAE